MSSKNPNYMSAFALYQQGHSLDQISETTGIPIDRLREQCSRHSWQGLAATLKSYYEARNELIPRLAPVDHALAVKKLETNRETNYAQAMQLHKLAQKTVDDWIKAATEPDEQGQTFTPRPKDLKELANAIATIHELTYRALGDTEAKREPVVGERQSGTPHIHINLPGVLVNPRGAKTIDVKTS